MDSSWKHTNSLLLIWKEPNGTPPLAYQAVWEKTPSTTVKAQPVTQAWDVRFSGREGEQAGET